MTDPLLEVEDLEKYYREGDTLFDRLLGRDPESVKAVDGLSFTVERGETLGLVGESGCGKSTTGETLLRLREPTGGDARFDGDDVFEMDDEALTAFRRRAGIVFQDPFSSLDPRMTAGAIVREPLELHDRPDRSERVDHAVELETDASVEVEARVYEDASMLVGDEPIGLSVASRSADASVEEDHDAVVRGSGGTVTVDATTANGDALDVTATVDRPSVTVEIHAGVRDRRVRRERVRHLLEQVGLSASQIDRYPHEFSGGQRQRIGIARALALEPDFVVLDEPVSALDVSVQAQILNLLEDLQDEFGLTYLFIAHDLSVVRHICDRVAVMYLGEIVETGPVEDIFEDPDHPYTEALLESVPRAATSEHGRRVDALQGDVPSPRNPPPGCRFHTRCPYAREACRESDPERIETGPDHGAACFRADEEHPYWDSDPLDHAGE